MVGFIIVLAVLVALIILTAIFARHFFKVVAGLWCVLFIVVIILGVFLYLDIQDLNKNFEKGSKIILLKQNDQIISGFRLEDNKKSTFFRSIDEYGNAYQAKNYAKLKGDAYKLLIAEKELFKEVDYVDVINYPVDRETLFAYLNEQQPRKKAAQYVAEENGIPEELVMDQIKKEFSTEDEFKGYLFAKIVGKALEGKGPNYVVRAYKAGLVEVYPETITFTVIDFLPQWIFDKLFEA